MTHLNFCVKKNGMKTFTFSVSQCLLNYSLVSGFIDTTRDTLKITASILNGYAL